MNIKPFQAVKFSKSAILKALAKAGNVVAEVKYDGIRGLTVIEPMGRKVANCHTFSRTNNQFKSMSNFMFDLGLENLKVFLDDFIFPNGMWLDGELEVKGMTFQESSGRIRSHAPISADRLTYIIYDVLPIEALETADEYDVPYVVRRMHTEVTVERLKLFFPQVNWVLAEAHDVYDMESLESLYEAKRADGHEGLVIKDPLAPYRRGKKVGYWKMKPEDTIDGKVIGVNWGTDGLANHGLVIGFEVLLEDGTVCNANGITQAQMVEFTRRVLTEGPDVFNDYSAQVRFMERTDDGGLRHPSFDCFRGTFDNPTQKA